MDLLRSNKIEMIPEAINTFSGNGKIHRAIFCGSIICNGNISIATGEITDGIRGIP